MTISDFGMSLSDFGMSLSDFGIGETMIRGRAVWFEVAVCVGQVVLCVTIAVSMALAIERWVALVRP